MTDISAKIIADSISPDGKRLTTIQMRYPRFIHAESKTHRQLVEQPRYVEEYSVPESVMYDPALSRNARSSRAVPVEKMLQEVMENPVIPIHWGAAQKGMQAYNENNAPVDIGRVLGFSHPMNVTNEQAWLMGRDLMVELARSFLKSDYAKQIINRLLEPWLHIDTLVSATEWTNFLGLRDHHMAEPHIQKLAQEVKAAMAASEPQLLQPGEWHTPYVSRDEIAEIFASDRCSYDNFDVRDGYRSLIIPISVARCARISYTPFDGNASIEKELERYDLLVGSTPLHASPAEHQATPDMKLGYFGRKDYTWENLSEHANFVGWRQFRKMLPNEVITEAA